MELRVSECCKEKGLTLQELADRLGIARSTLANTLTKRNPTLDTLEKIAKALDVTVFDLFIQDQNDSSIVCPVCHARFELKTKD